MNKLPMGWVEVELGQLGSIHTGKTPSTKDKDNFGGDILFVKPADLDNGGYIYETADYLSEKGLAQLPNLPKNAIMVTCIGNLGKVGITTQTCATNQQINSIIPNENLVNYKFLYYQILTLKNWLDENSSATTVSIINKSRFSKAPIYLPPKAEQDHIATLLENHLSQVATISQKLNDILPIIKQFRQSVLAQAVSGKLLNTENEFQSNIKHIAKFQSGYAFKSEWFEKSSEYQIIKLANIRDNFLFIENSPSYVNSEIAEKHRDFIPQKNDILISMTGTRFKRDYGFCCLIGESQKILVNQRVGRFIVNQDLINPKFLLIVLRSEYFRDKFFQGETGGVNQGNVGSKHIQDILINYPNLTTQAKIVAEVERLFALADTIETQVNEALERVGYLTQSILHQAFTGNLSADWRKENAELITGEHSATALLAQISLQKQSPQKKKSK